MSASPVPTARTPIPDEAAGEAPALRQLSGGYRFGGRPLRVLALGATVLVHLAVGAVVMLGWPAFHDSPVGAHLVSVTILPRPMDQPRRHPDPGTQTGEPKPEPLSLRSSPPPAIVLAPPAPIAVETVAEIPAPADGGRIDTLALATQAYRRAVMAKLEAQRARISQQAPGSGMILFRIERSGGLLGVEVAQTTGSHALDRAALTIVRRAAPFPVIPEALPDELEITLPVEFLLPARVARR